MEGAFSPLQGFPVMEVKNMTYDGGFLIFTEEEKSIMVKSEPGIEKFIIKLQSGSDFIDNIFRYTFWIEDSQLEEALKFNNIKNRIDKVREYRLQSGDVAKTLVSKAYQFRYPKKAKDHFIILPIVSSERREYLPIGILGNDVITTNAAYGIYDSKIWIFGIISSRLHLLWVKTICGRLESRIRYSSSICYNTFPFPTINEAQKAELEELAQEVLDVRDQHFDMTLGEQYNPETMPEALKEVHHRLDLAVERCYRPEPFSSDEERLECLFKLYAKMTKK